MSRARTAAVFGLLILSGLCVLPARHALAGDSDLDGDGYTRSSGDCCETTTECPWPTLVNAGAFEISSNGTDDDCDAATPDAAPAAACSTTPLLTGLQPGDLARAMGICQATFENPPPPRRWGLIGATFNLSDGRLPNATALAQIANQQAAVLSTFGPTVPLEGPTFAGLSTGRMRDADDPGYAPPAPGTEHGRENAAVPQEYLAANNGQLPTGGTCAGICSSNQSIGFDSVALSLRIRVPTNAVALVYRYQYFASDFREFPCSSFNDWHLTLLFGLSPDLPADRNIARSPAGDHVRVGDFPFPSCQAAGCETCPLGLAALAGTGFDELQRGATTQWETARGAVLPGETIEWRPLLFDSGDGRYDSSLLLDGFAWVPEVIFGGPFQAGFEPAP